MTDPDAFLELCSYVHVRNRVRVATAITIALTPAHRHLIEYRHSAEHLRRLHSDAVTYCVAHHGAYSREVIVVYTNAMDAIIEAFDCSGEEDSPDYYSAFVVYAIRNTLSLCLNPKNDQAFEWVCAGAHGLMFSMSDSEQTTSDFLDSLINVVTLIDQQGDMSNRRLKAICNKPSKLIEAAAIAIVNRYGWTLASR